MICCQLIWNVFTSTYLYMPLGFCIPEWIQNGIHFESGMSTVSSMLHWDSQTVLFSRGWGIDQPKFSQDKPRVVTVSTPEYHWFVFSNSSLLSCSFCCILELKNSSWYTSLLLTYTLHLVIFTPWGVFRCRMMLGPLASWKKFKPSRSWDFPVRRAQEKLKGVFLFVFVFVVGKRLNVLSAIYQSRIS